jgi:hypothetical protein
LVCFDNTPFYQPSAILNTSCSFYLLFGAIPLKFGL